MLVMHLDVLALPGESAATRQPSLEGRRLWNILFPAFSGRMVVLADSGANEELLLSWLKREGYKPSMVHIAKELWMDGSNPRADAVWDISAVFGKVSWYVDVDPETCAYTIAKGIPTLLVAVPTISRPEWREPKAVRGWDAITQEIDQQQRIRAEREWVGE